MWVNIAGLSTPSYEINEGVCRNSICFGGVGDYESRMRHALIYAVVEMAEWVIVTVWGCHWEPLSPWSITLSCVRYCIMRVLAAALCHSLFTSGSPGPCLACRDENNVFFQISLLIDASICLLSGRLPEWRRCFCSDLMNTVHVVLFLTLFFLYSFFSPPLYFTPFCSSERIAFRFFFLEYLSFWNFKGTWKVNLVVSPPYWILAQGFMGPQSIRMQCLG